MKIIQQENNVILTEVCDFSVSQTLECGQCFHFKRIGENEYGISAYDKLLHIKQKEDEIVFYNTSIEEFNNIWKNYFDLDKDYGRIKEILKKKSDVLNEAMDEMWGVRILNQEFFETLISFIISQNKQIPHIKQIVETISKQYGKYLGSLCGQDFYSFPHCDELAKVSIQELRECKVGFRAPYIFDAVSKVCDGTINESDFIKLNSEDTMLKLMEIKGVGEKVANCVMLFSLGKRDAFPVDVWIKRIMEYLYFHENISKEEIRRKAYEMFGEYGGYAQQYLFYYGKENNLGK